jgi:3-acetyloctanal aminotransferase
MRFGFLAHPVSPGERNLVRAAMLLSQTIGERTGRTAVEPDHVRIPMYTSVTSVAGARCTGEVRYLPHTAEGLLSGLSTSTDYVVHQVNALAANGARLVGLGGASSIVGRHGLRVREQVDVPLTSGNSLTTFAAHALVRSVLERFGEDPAETRIGIVGFPGSIGLALARLLAYDGCRLWLVCRQGRVRPDELLAELPIDMHDRVTIGDDAADCAANTDFIVAASSTGGILDEATLRPGTVVVDVALPRDVRASTPAREDVLVLDGGLVSAAEEVLVDGSSYGLTENLNGCLAETIVLALAGRAESFSLGRELSIERIREIGALADRHGFVVPPPTSRGRQVSADRLDQLAEIRRSTLPRTGKPGSPSDPTSAARRRFEKHVNPPLSTLYRAHGIDRVFVSGSGATLTAADGTRYLDFIGGYGCLNVGHNHPRVTNALRKFLDRGEPTFVQYASIPTKAGELAERLCALAPGSLERVFFSNSGTEAVEAALKLARAATGRTKFVHAQNSYHGKTFGALSVTGRAAHAGPFGPLLPDCVAVPYGDEPALRAALEGAAAFIVEPVQGEGGVVLPPPGYLSAAERLCRTAGAVFIVDEIQTGLGRTGRLFASEWDELEPDVLCLAKALSGGLVPIGATLATAEMWDAAYGTSTRAALHTSTFGGGNLAASVGLATLDTLEDEDLASRADALGRTFRESLAQACAPFEFVGEVRGIGMMNAIAFAPAFDGAMQALTDDLLTRLPGGLRELAGTIPDELRSTLRAAGQHIESALSDMLCMRFISALGTDHRMLTFVTANSNQVMRIQPPLVLTDFEAQRFVKAVRAVCESTEHQLRQ